MSDPGFNPPPLEQPPFLACGGYWLASAVYLVFAVGPYMTIRDPSWAPPTPIDLKGKLFVSCVLGVFLAPLLMWITREVLRREIGPLLGEVARAVGAGTLLGLFAGTVCDQLGVFETAASVEASWLALSVGASARLSLIFACSAACFAARLALAERPKHARL